MKINDISKKINAVDFITIVYISITFLLIIAANSKLQNISFHIFIRIIFVSIIFLLIWINSKTKNVLILLLRNLYPLFFISFFYSETDYFNNIFFNDLDFYFSKLDMMIFGFQPSIEFYKHFQYKWFNELMHFSYFFYYPLIFFFAIYYFFKKNEIFKKYFFHLITFFYIFYLLFIIIPCAGPQYYFAPPLNEVSGAYFFSNIMIIIQHLGEVPSGAFPSSHIGITWMIMFVFYKYSRKIFYPLLLPVLLLSLSTVYIKAHYAIDVFAGLLVIPLFFCVSRFLYKAILKLLKS